MISEMIRVTFDNEIEWSRLFSKIPSHLFTVK